VQRIASALVLVPLVLGIIQYGSPELFVVLVLAAVLGGWREYVELSRNMGFQVYSWVGAALCVLLVICFYFNDYFSLWVLTSLTALFVAWYVKENQISGALDPVAYSFLGLIYVAGLMGSFILLRHQEQANLWLYFLFMIIWIGDTAAYFVGKILGRTQLVPEISPGKTVEGAIGGLIGSLGAGLLARHWFLPGIPLTHCLIMSFLCGTIGQIGDLVESLLKRSAGVKDSGSVIPGHGGILDRLDSLMFAGPALYWYHRFFL